MRILKRNLAFVLVLVMALSLTVSAANVNDYKDANDVSYVEAVDVMTALGILQGEDGVFNPKNTLTREQGAKIIAYMMLGKNAADKLTTSVAPFNDVAANRWSAGYVAYCANKGIIGGYGDGNFGPNDQLTGTQFAKMLLCAVGYGVNGEYSGNGWESAVNSTALVNGVFEGNDGLTLSAACNREEAALYAFNTLTAVLPVQYSKAFDCYYTGTVLNSVDKNTDGWKNYTLAKTLYNLTEDNTVTDAFERACRVWKQGSKPITAKFYDAPKATYTKEVTSKAIYADLGLTEDKVTAEVFVDGCKAAGFDLTKDDPTKLPDGGNGVAVEAFVGKDKEDKTTVKLVVVNTYLAKVTSVKDGTVTVDLYKAPEGANKTFKTSVAFEENDYVLVTLGHETVKGKDGKDKDVYNIQSMVEAEQVTGKLDAAASNYVKVDGTKYSFSAKLDKENVFTKNYNATMSVILDENGYLIGMVVKTAAATKNEGYVLVTGSKFSEGNLLTSNAAVVEVMLLDGNGYKVLPLPTRVTKVDGEKQAEVMIPNQGTNKDKTDWDKLVEKNDAITEGFYGYYMDDNGCIVLRNLKSSEKQVLGGSIDYNQSQTGTIKDAADKELEKALSMNSATELVLVSETKAETVTGHKNISIKDTDVDMLFVLDTADGEMIKKAYVINGETTTADVFAYFGGVDYVYESDDKTYVTLYVNGVDDGYEVSAKVQDMLKKDGKWVVGGYTIETSGKSLTKATLKTEAAQEVAAVKELYFQVGETKVYYAEDAKVFDMTDGGATGTVAKGDKVVYVLENGLATYVWIVE